MHDKWHTRTSGICAFTLGATSSISALMIQSALCYPGYYRQQGPLTLAVVHMNDGISILEGIDNTSDETPGSFGSSVDSNKTERSLRRGHCDG